MKLSLFNSPSVWFPALLEPDAQLTLPLSREITLFAHWRPGGLPHYGVSEDQVRTFNLLSSTRARDLYVAPKPVFPGHDEILTKIEREAAAPESEPGDVES